MTITTNKIIDNFVDATYQILEDLKDEEDSKELNEINQIELEELNFNIE